MGMSYGELYQKLDHRLYAYNMHVWAWFNKDRNNYVGLTSPKKRISIKEFGNGNYEIYFHQFGRRIAYTLTSESLSAEICSFDLCLTAEKLQNGSIVLFEQIDRLIGKEIHRDIPEELLNDCKESFIQHGLFDDRMSNTAPRSTVLT